MRRLLIVAFLPLMALLAAALLAVAWLLVTPAGASLLIGFAEDRFPVRVEDVEGSVVGQVCASAVAFGQPGLRVRATDVCIDVDLWSSLDFVKIDLHSIRAGEIAIQTEPSSASGDRADVRLPLAIEISELGVRRLLVNEVEITALFGTVALRNRSFETDIAFVFGERRFQVQSGGPLSKLAFEVRAEEFVADGRVDVLADRLPYSIRLTSSRLALDEWIDRALVIESATLTARGDLDGYRFTLEAGAIDPLVEIDRIAAEGTGTFEGLEFVTDIRNLRAPDYQLMVSEGSVSGSVGWRDELSVALRGQAAAGRAGEVSFAGALELSVRNGITTVDGGRFELQSPYGGAVALHGVVGSDGQIDFEVAVERVTLALLREGVGGTVSGVTEVRGPTVGLDVRGRYQLDDPAWSSIRARSAAVAFDGRADGGLVTIEMTGDGWDAASRLTFAREENEVRVDLETLSATLTESPAGRLAAALLNPTTVTIADGGARGDEACFELQPAGIEVEPATLCGSFRYPQGPLVVKLSPLAIPGYALVRGELLLGGWIEAEASLINFDPFAGELTVGLADLVAVNDNDEALALGDLTIRGVLDDDVVAVNVLSGADQRLQVTGDGRLTIGEPFRDSAMEGTAALSLDGIWVAESVLPMDVTYELDRLRGVLNLAAELSGTVAEPLVNGRVSLEEGGWLVQASNTEFSDIELGARLFESTRLELDGGGKVGEGSLAISGELVLGDEPQLNSEVALEDALAVDLPDYSAHLSGTVDLRMVPEAMWITGDLQMPRASIDLSELPETAVSVSADERVVGEAPPTQQHRTSDVRLELGDDVRFRAFGLDTLLRGQLQLRERPGLPPELTGVLDLVDGRFEAYGQDLTIDRGRLTFSGSMDDPEVDVAASSVVEHGDRNVRITLYLTGTAQTLNTTVGSDPVLPESDALALLMTGRTLSEMTDSEQSNVYGAAISLGLLGARRLTAPVGSTLGLDEIILDQDDNGGMRVGAAIRINRDLYFRYTYSAFSRMGGALLRYRLSDRISLQAQTGDAHSIEIRYGVD